MPVHKLSAQGSLTTSKVDYPSMLAGYGDFGSLQRIAWKDFSVGATAFSNIPQTYRDLYVVTQMRGTNANTVEFAICQVNGTSSSHSFTGLYGDGSTVASTRNSPGGIAPSFFYLGLLPGGNSTTGVFGTITIHILNYRSTVNKTFLWRLAGDQNGSGQSSMGVGLFASSSPVTSLTIIGSNGTNGAAALYGVKASAA